MIRLRFEQLASLTEGRLQTTADTAASFAGVSVDSRSLAAEQVFFAIRGDLNDGHEYIEQAIAAGAAGVVVDNRFEQAQALSGKLPVVSVENTHLAMLRLAEKYLDSLNPLRIGLTGSNGKTTTKEFAYCLLSAVAEKVYRSPGNFNNLFGIPLAIFEMPEDTSIAILEMGISTPGEMDRLGAIVKPNLIVVTNIGATHLEFLGTVENVAHEKLRAMYHAQPDAGLIINGDDPVLVAEAAKLDVHPVTFAIDNNADFRPEKIETGDDGTTTVTITGQSYRLPLFGKYQVYNLLAARAVVAAAGFEMSGVDTETLDLSTAEMRGEIVEVRGVTFIADCYNANPESVRAGLAGLADREIKGRLILILGDMLELGGQSARYHRAAGQQAAELKPDLLAAVGSEAIWIAESARAHGMPSVSCEHFGTANECAVAMVRFLQAGDTVYLKGSRGIGLEKVLQQFKTGEGNG